MAMGIALGYKESGIAYLICCYSTILSFYGQVLPPFHIYDTLMIYSYDLRMKCATPHGRGGAEAGSACCSEGAWGRSPHLNGGVLWFV